MAKISLVVVSMFSTFTSLDRAFYRDRVPSASPKSGQSAGSCRSRRLNRFASRVVLGDILNYRSLRLKHAIGLCVSTPRRIFVKSRSSEGNHLLGQVIAHFVCIEEHTPY